MCEGGVGGVVGDVIGGVTGLLYYGVCKGCVRGYDMGIIGGMIDV